MDFSISNIVPEDECFSGCMDPSSKSVAANGEKILLSKLTSLLSGIPPPPSIATSKLTCSQMLESLKINIDILEFKNVEAPLRECNPKVFYVNKDILSEEISDLTMKLQARFVQSETASSYSIQANIDRQLSNSARKRRHWNGISPGRRLSHLAKRRQMFSKANLQQLSKNEQKVHKIAMSKPTAQRNLAKEYLEYKDNTSKDRSLPKRALFQSPEDDVLPGFRTVARNVPKRKLFVKPERSVQLPVGGGSYDVSSWLATQPFMGGKKRSREESRESDRKRRCPRRSLDFSDGSPSQCSDASALSNGVCQAPPPNVPLTQVQKQKLLWAVAVVLKERKITHKDSRFKKCATSLFTICKKNLSTIQSLSLTAGTSEKMLTYARSKVDYVIKQSQLIPTTNKVPGVLHDLSSSTLNKIQNGSHDSIKLDGKENVSKTPKRKKKVRHWQTCIKSNNKRKSRLNKSLSFDDLREINEKQLNLSTNEPVFKLSRNSPFKIKTPAKRKHCEAFNFTNNSTNDGDVVNETVILETPDKYQNNSDCIPGSQEEIDSHNFPALTRKQSLENISFSIRSPDLFEEEEDYPVISKQKTDPEINNAFNPIQDLEGIENLNCSATLKDNCLDISAVLLESNSLPIELNDCVENETFSEDVVLINNELLSSAVDISNMPDPSGNASFLECEGFVVGNKLTEDQSSATSPEDQHNLDKSVSRVSVLNESNQETYINELPTLFTEVVLNESNLLVELPKDISTLMGAIVPNNLEKEVNLTHHSYNPITIDNTSKNNEISSEILNVTHTSEENCKNVPLSTERGDSISKSEVESDTSSDTGDESSSTNTEESNCVQDYCIMNDTKAEFSIIQKSYEGSFVDIMDDDDVKPSSNVCTSTPLVEFSKKLMIKSKPAWRLEAGPGLKIRMRLSKDWDIVGRRDSQLSDSSEAFSYENNIDVGVEAKPAKTQIDNSLIRKICNGESSGTSMDSYTLTEMRDRLAIEKTLADDNSDLSLFNSDSSCEVSSSVEKDDSCDNNDMLRIGNSLTENCNYGKDLETQHHSFENMLECAMLEKKQDISAVQSHILTDSDDSHLSAASNEPTSDTNNFSKSGIEDIAPTISETSPLQNCSSKTLETAVPSNEIVDNNVKRSSFNAKPLIPHKPVTDFKDVIMVDDICQAVVPVDEDDVPLIKLVLETSTTSSNRDMSENIDIHVCNDESCVDEKLLDEDDVPLIQFISESSRSAVADLRQTETAYSKEFDKIKDDDLRMSLDENVPLIRFVSCQSSRSSTGLNQRKLESASFEEFDSKQDNKLRLSLDENVPLIQFVSELSRSGIPEHNQLEDNNDNNLRMSLDENVPLIQFVSELSRSDIPKFNQHDDNKDNNLRISLDENVPLIQFVSESSRSGFANLDQTNSDIDNNTYSIENANKNGDDLRMSLDENIPLIKLIQESKSGSTELIQETSMTKSVSYEHEELCKSKINDLRQSFDDDLPLKYLELPKENNVPHIPEFATSSLERSSSEVDSCSDDDKPLMTSDRQTPINCILDDSDDLPLCQLADNSCPSKISKFNQDPICNDDDNVPLIQLKTGTCDIANNNENYDPTKKYDLLLNQLNRSVITERNDESNLIGINNSTISSEAEDIPLCHLISHTSNDNLASDDFEKQSNELSALTSQTSNVLDENKTSDNEVRHFKEISVIKNKLESNCDIEKLTKTRNNLENKYQTPSKASTVSESTPDSRLMPMSAGSDTSTGKSRTKLSLESYKARKKLVLEPNNDGISPPKKIYNIRLKKKERHYRRGERRRSSLLETSNENWDDECRDDSDNIDKLFIDKAKTFVNAFSTISCMVDKEMKLTVSAIADDKERERKLRKLSNVSEMSDNILQAFFEQIPNAKSIFTSDS